MKPTFRIFRFHYLAIALSLASISLPAFADYTVTGKFQYEDKAFDKNGLTGATDFKPIRFAEVRIVAAADSSILAKGATDASGTFSVTVPGTSSQSIKALCYPTSTSTPGLLLDVRVGNSDLSFGSFYYASSNAIVATGSGTTTVGTVLALASSSEGKAFNIWDVCYDGMEFINSLTGSFPTQKFTALWSPSHRLAGAQSFYFTGTNRFAYIDVGSGYDDPVIAQEFGHFIADVYSKLDTPNPQVVPVAIFGDGGQDIRLAWSEGVSLFLGAAIRQFKGYPNPEQFFFSATDGKTLAFSLNIQDLTASIPLKSRTGSTNMLAVAASLWDITSNPLQRPFGDIWKVLTDYIPKLTTAGITVERFWDGWFAEELGYLAEMQNIFATVNGIELLADAQEADNSADVAPTVPVAPIALKSGARVVINEIDVSDPDAVELYNAGDTAADLTGWTLAASRATQVTVNVTFPAITLKPGGFAVLYAASGVNSSSRIYSGGKFPWAYGLDGACALRNQDGAGVDFVRWGNSTEFPPGGTNFSGSNPATPPEGKTLNRNFAGDDTDSGSDWAAQNTSLGTFNLGGSEKHHTFYPADDVDYAAFNATAGKNYLIETINTGNGADTVLDLIGTDGSTVVTTNDDIGLGSASRIVWAASSSGKYYVLARRYTGALNLAQYGSYDLRIVESSPAVGPGGFETLTVSKSGGVGTYQTVSDAVAAAGNGDTVQITDSETYNEAISISGKTLNLKALKGQKPVLSGAGKTSASATLSVSNVKSFNLDGWTISGGPRGIRFSGGDAVITNTAVTGVTGGSGVSDPDGIQVLSTGTTARIENCSVTGNARLGILIASGAAVRLTACRVAGNTQGGIAVTLGNASAKIVNVLMTGNGSSSYDEIQVSGEGTNATIVNSTIVGANRSGVAVFTKASARIVNSIIINHTSADVGGDGTATNLVVKNNLMARASQIGKDGNINGDPKFVSAKDGDYHLQSSSPAIDKGDGTDPDLPTSDYDGLPRSMDGSGKGSAVPDMGAFEYLSLASLTSSSILPQVAVGGDASSSIYRTSIIAVNTGSLAALVNVSLTKSDGTPLTVDTPDKSASAFNLLLPAGGTARLETASSGSTVAGYARFLSNLPVDGTALFKTVSGSEVISEAGVGLSKPAKSFMVYIDNTNDAISGYAIANPGATAANLTLTLRNKSGGQVGTPLTTILAAGQHLARFAFQDFAAVTEGFEGTIEVTSDADVAAVALRYDNKQSDVFSTIPVLTNQVANTLYFPQVADGSSYRTNFILVNPNNSPTSARLEFFDDKGSPLSLPIGGTLKTSNDVPLAAKGAGRFVTDGTTPGVGVGWVKVTSPDNIGGSAIFQTVVNSKITSEAGVSSSPLTSHFTTYVDGTGWTLSGVAICSPDSSSVTGITLNLRDTAGKIVATTGFTLPALGHVAKFFTQWFPDIKGDFEGTLEVIATKPVSGVALRYDNQSSNVFATLPVVVIQ